MHAQVGAVQPRSSTDSDPPKRGPSSQANGPLLDRGTPKPTNPGGWALRCHLRRLFSWGYVGPQVCRRAFTAHGARGTISQNPESRIKYQVRCRRATRTATRPAAVCCSEGPVRRSVRQFFVSVAALLPPSQIARMCTSTTARPLALLCRRLLPPLGSSFLAVVVCVFGGAAVGGAAARRRGAVFGLGGRIWGRPAKAEAQRSQGFLQGT